MTQQEIIELATKVYGECDWHESALHHLEAFAKLVAEKVADGVSKHAETHRLDDIEIAVAAEREACAKVAEDWSKRDDDVGAFVAKAIRARGEA